MRIREHILLMLVTVMLLALVSCAPRTPVEVTDLNRSLGQARDECAAAYAAESLQAAQGEVDSVNGLADAGKYRKARKDAMRLIPRIDDFMAEVERTRGEARSEAEAAMASAESALEDAREAGADFLAAASFERAEKQLNEARQLFSDPCRYREVKALAVDAGGLADNAAKEAVAERKRIEEEHRLAEEERRRREEEEKARRSEEGRLRLPPTIEEITWAGNADLEAPSEMSVDVEEDVTLTIALDAGSQPEEEEEPTVRRDGRVYKVKSKPVRVGWEMEAELISKPDGAFKIKPEGSRRQDINREAIWSWAVTPLKPGKHELKARLRITKDKDENPINKELEVPLEEITVNITIEEITWDGKVLLDAPREMFVDVGEDVTLTITLGPGSQPEEDKEFTVHPDGQYYRVRPVRVGWEIEAELISTTDGAFKIKPEGSRRQDINRKAIWSWAVTPLKPGKHELKARLRITKDEANDPIDEDLEVPAEESTVTITIKRRITRLLEEYGKWLLGALIIPIILLLFKFWLDKQKAAASREGK